MKIKTIRELINKIDTNFFNNDAIIIEKDKNISYLKYYNVLLEINKLSYILINKGIQKGDRIGLMSENRKEWIITYLAITNIGAIITPISIFWEQEEIKELYLNADFKMLFTSVIYIKKILKVKNIINNTSNVICFDNYNISNKNNDILIYKTIINSIKEDNKEIKSTLDKINIKPEDTAEILFVSSKLGVELSHSSILSNVYSIKETLYPNINKEKKLMTIFPFSHLYPTVFGILLPFLMGWSIITTDTGRMDRIIKIIKEIKPNYILMVPLLLERFLNRLKIKLNKNSFNSLGLQNIEFIFVAGVKCPEDLIDKVQKTGLTVLEGYGVSEMSPFLTLNTKNANKTGSVGKPLKNVKIKIDNPKENIGEVLAKGPNMMKGYLNLILTEENFKEYGALFIDDNGWIHTGDKGYIDEDGFLYIIGRSRNILVTKGGTNIYPKEIEDKLIKSPYINNVRIVSRFDDFNGDYPFAEIVLNEKKCSNITKNKLESLIQEEIEKLSGKIASYKIPKSFQIKKKLNY